MFLPRSSSSFLHCLRCKAGADNSYMSVILIKATQGCGELRSVSGTNLESAKGCRNASPPLGQPLLVGVKSKRGQGFIRVAHRYGPTGNRWIVRSGWPLLWSKRNSRAVASDETVIEDELYKSHA